MMKSEDIIYEKTDFIKILKNFITFKANPRMLVNTKHPRIPNEIFVQIKS